MTPSTALAAAPAVAASPLAPRSGAAACIVAAAAFLLPHLEQGRRVDATILRAAMEQAEAEKAKDPFAGWDPKKEAAAARDSAIGKLKHKATVEISPKVKRTRTKEIVADDEDAGPVGGRLARRRKTTVTVEDEIERPTAKKILATLRGDGYYVNKLTVPGPNPSDRETGVEGRIYPELGLGWKLPMTRPHDNGISEILEPQRTPAGANASFLDCHVLGATAEALGCLSPDLLAQGVSGQQDRRTAHHGGARMKRPEPFRHIGR